MRLRTALILLARFSVEVTVSISVKASKGIPSRQLGGGSCLTDSPVSPHHVEREGLARPGSELSGLPGLPQPRRQRPHVISREGGAFSQGAAPAPPENGPHARQERLRANKEKRSPSRCW